ncbi:uncharacterized protein DNG_02360 [Cephalotrichum gorgonifer]|uniref:Protein kinase domain-containing protein n=1 Tax=Cephalotrichum gorgonifer TaxID=2041049 RepID=A0AAE8MSW4_9PEZI|nr:uncharacterized protein DNG_02360 [Cephalotrichum gorgonifer]
MAHIQHPGMIRRSDIHYGEKIGSGAIGKVFAAIDLRNNAAIAVKVMRRGTEWDDSIRAEIAALKRFNHDFIIPLQGVIYEEAYFRIVMPLRDGSLTDLVDSVGGTLSPQRHTYILNSLLKQGLSALRYIHDLGYCHRDVKPCNFLYYEFNGQYTFQLADFGLVKAAGDRSSRCGTRVYMAPETCRWGRQTGLVDVWGLFVTVAQVLGLIDAEKLENARRVDITAAVARAAAKLPYLADMARVECSDRFSAADMISSLRGVRPEEIFQPVTREPQAVRLAGSQSGELNMLNLWVELLLTMTNKSDIDRAIKIFKRVILCARVLLPAIAGRHSDLALDLLRAIMRSARELLPAMRDRTEVGWEFILEPIMELVGKLLAAVERHARGGVGKWMVLLFRLVAELEPNVCLQQLRSRLAIADDSITVARRRADKWGHRSTHNNGGYSRC